MTRALRALRALQGAGPVRLLAGGLLVLQLVWLFAVPPFRGADEFDHAYRAAAVARGQWVPEPTAATRGTGAWQDVPTDLVEAARPQCSVLEYTLESDCVGTRVDDDTTRVASGAGRYHPLFYAVVGTAALPFDGVAAVYAMRGAAALMTWVFFVLALVATRCWARSRWPYVALAAAVTPVVAYSAAIPAPNGLEMTSAMALWCALLGLAVRPDARRDGRLLTIATLAATVLVTLRSFGPLWCVLVLVTVLCAVRVGAPRLRTIVVRSRGWVAMLVVLAATVASTGWILGMGSMVVGAAEEPAPLSVAVKASAITGQAPLWVLQSIAAFPLRNEHTHPAVYGLFFLVFATLVVAALRVGSGRGRFGLAVAAGLSLLVPAAASYATLESYGTAWQGRYGLPYAVGMVLVAGMILDQRRTPPRTDLLVAGALCFVAAHGASPLLVSNHERLISPGVENGAWVLVPPVLLGGLAVVGASLLWLGAAFGHQDLDDADPREEVADDRPHRPGVTVGADR